MVMEFSASGSASDRRDRRLLILVTVIVSVFLVWAWLADLDEVALGDGKVVPSTKAKVIQTLEGGILAELFVREGDFVAAGQPLATLDESLARSTVGETSAKITALRAKAARLQAEMGRRDTIVFPDDVASDATAVKRETEVFQSKRAFFDERVRATMEQLRLAERELSIVEPLQKSGASNQVELLRLQQKISELRGKLLEVEGGYSVEAKKDYSDVMAELEPLLSVREGRADKLRRAKITSPARGIVKDIQVSTIGGVLSPGGILMEIVPVDDQLLVEARLSPRDIAFIRPDQETTVKFTAYDSAIYGTLHGKVDRISPDTIQDDVQRSVYYYRVYVRTDQSYLTTPDGKQHAIIPGMIATAEIRTGKKTVLTYLIKPLNRAADALRQR